MMQFYPAEPEDPFIELLGPPPSYDIWINSHWYYNEQGLNRFAYTNITGDYPYDDTPSNH